MCLSTKIRGILLENHLKSKVYEQEFMSSHQTNLQNPKSNFKSKESQIGGSGSEAYKNPSCRDSEVHPFLKETRQIQASRTGKYESIAHPKKQKLKL